MDPVTLGVIGLAGSVLSAGVGAFGAMQQAGAASDAAKYQAQVARNNQITADQNARYAADAGAAAGQARDFRNRAVAGGILAAQGASGIDVGSTTSREVRESAAEVGRLDTATIMSDAMLKSRAYTTQGVNFEADARMSDSKASNASTAGLIGAGSSLLGGASSFADKWMRYKTVGIGGY